MTESIKSFIYRKLIHLCAACLPLLYWLWLEREQILIISGLLCIGFVTVDVWRLKSEQLNLIFKNIFGPLLTDNEKKINLTGATHLLISATIILVLFSKKIAIPVLLIMSISDPMAAMIGKKTGKYQLFRKTWEGSLTFFVTSSIILILNGTDYVWAACTGLATTIAEVMPLPVNDNYTIGIVSALLLSLIS